MGLTLNHNPGQGAGWNPPGGFNGEVDSDCAIIGAFNAIQYRVSPLPPTLDPTLERRDLTVATGAATDWTPVSRNIENLQFQYAVGADLNFVDEPPTPVADDPNTWVTRVRITVAGRSDSAMLQGASDGIFDPGDTYLRRTFSTTVSPRNQLNAASVDDTFYH